MSGADKINIDKIENTIKMLEALNIEYERIDHAPTATIDDCKLAEEKLEIEICKNLLLRNASKKDFYLLIMSGSKRFITKNISKQIGSSRLSFAEDEYMESLVGISPGSLSVLGLMNDKEHKVKLLIDEDVLANEYFGCHPCVNTASLKLRTKDIVEKFLPYTGHVFQTVNL
jgi:Ala-tRNA(Pro) deacylase